MTGESLGHLLQELLLQKGVLDVYYTAVMMKKNRPGTLLTVLVEAEQLGKIEAFLLLNSSSFGVRSSPNWRQILKRELIQVQTIYGKIQFKLGFYQNKLVKVTPEYEDVARLAKTNQMDFLSFYHWAIGEAQKVKQERTSQGEK